MSELNPYATPGADFTPEPSGNFTLTEPKTVPIGRSWGWIAGGFEYFKKNPGAWILTLIFSVICAAVISLIPILGQIAMMLIAYVIWAGFMLGCHAQAKGENFSFGHLFAGFSKNAGQLVLLSVLMSIASMAIMFASIGPIYFEMLAGGAEQNPQLMADPLSFLKSMAIGMLFMIPLAMAVWFAPALIAINDVPLFKAIKMSFTASLKNFVTFLLYFIICFVLYVVAIIPLGLGLLVLGPTLIASIYVSYREIFTE